MKYVIINGSGGVGKDLFCNYAKIVLRSMRKEFFNYSTVDYVKESAMKLGWNGIKDERGRKFLSDLKAAMTEYNDIPFKITCSFVEDFTRSYKSSYNVEPDGIGFIHCREKKEIDKLVKALSAKKLLIVRDNAEAITSNPSDKNVMDIEYDFVIDNSGNEEDLLRIVRFFVEAILE